MPPARRASTLRFFSPAAHGARPLRDFSRRPPTARIHHAVLLAGRPNPRVPRLTQDVDITLAASPARLDDVLAVCAAAGAAGIHHGAVEFSVVSGREQLPEQARALERESGPGT
jgi:hypothetical protein